jgi:hypothetical protein
MCLGNKAGPARKVDNLATMCEPTLYKMLNPLYFKASMTRYGIALIFSKEKFYLYIA